MALQKLSLESLGQLDFGKVSAAFQKEVGVVVRDMMDRPGDKTARKVTLELKLEPTIADDGDCEGAYGDFTIRSKVPDRKTKAYNFSVNKAGNLIFSEESPDNVNQTTIDEMGPDGKVTRQYKD